jgi:acylphosphatase
VSILVVQPTPQGLLFGADRNITSQLTLSDGTIEVVVSGQSERPKVLKWTQTMRFETTEQRDTTMQYGVEEGAKAGFARVDALLEKIAA